MRCCGISCSAARNSTGRVSNSPSFRRSHHVRVQAGWSYRHRPWLANQCIVIGMRSDPEPEHTIRNIHTEGPVVIANAHGAKTRDVLEMEGWMPRICLQEREILVREALDLHGQRLVAPPELSGRVMRQSARDCPLRCWLSAASAKASSLPACASAVN